MIFAILEPIEEPLLWLLQQIHGLGPTWAWSIILLTFLVRLALVPLTVKQQQSMRAMQALQPQIKALQSKHKSDRQQLNQEMMAFYKENKVNPFGSCLPLLAQAPIFLALYFVLRDLEKDGIKKGDDLSFLWGFVPNITDHLNELPTATLWILMIVYVGSQMGSTLLMPTSVDPRQKYIFLALPLVFALVIVNQSFPAGLLLYWITTNLWTVAQAAVIRQFFPPPIPPGSEAAKLIAREEKAKAKAKADKAVEKTPVAPPRGATPKGTKMPPAAAPKRNDRNDRRPPPSSRRRGGR